MNPMDSQDRRFVGTGLGSMAAATPFGNRGASTTVNIETAARPYAAVQAGGYGASSQNPRP
jgi:hypothetical protein